MHNTVTASGKRAPMFYKYWKLTTHKNDFPKGAAWVFGEGSKTDVQSGEIVPKEIFLEHVKPALIVAPAAVFGEGSVAIDTPPQQAAIEDNTSKY
jgi:hypothetical protein